MALITMFAVSTIGQFRRLFDPFGAWVLRRGVLVAAAVAASVALASSARAETYVFHTSDSQFRAGVENQGWWSPTRPNSDLNDNYYVGRLNGHLLNNFFTFDLSSLDLTDKLIQSVRLEVSRFEYASPFPFETYVLYDVSTPADILNYNRGTSAAIYSDLGSGTSYGSFAVSRGPRTDILSFQLNDAARYDIRRAAGGWFSIGGTLQDVSGPPTRGIFSSSANGGVQRLVIETRPNPEPTSLALLGLGSAALAAARHRRKQRAL